MNGKKHTEVCPSIIHLVIREMQIKTTVRHHFIPTRMAIIKKTDNKCWQGCGETEDLYTPSGNVERCSCFGGQFDSPRKINHSYYMAK